ncbi:MAG: NEW3 domain-containing protein [Haloarculaceae archaeon]
MKYRLGSAALASVLAVVVVGAALSMGAVPGAAAKYNDFSEPELSPTIQSGNTLDPGETKTLSVAVQNRHDGITDTDRAIDGISQVVQTHRLNLGAASATTVSFEAGEAPVDVKSGEQSLGTITPGNSRQASLTLEVDDDAQPGTYDIPVTITHTYIHTIIVDRDDYIVHRNTRTVTKDVTVRVEKDGQLDVLDVSSQGLYENAEGTVEVSVRNDGTEVMREARLNLLDSPHLQPASNSVSLGTLEPNETATASFQARVSGIDTASSYSVGFRMAYEDENGQPTQSKARSGSVSIDSGPTFEMSAEAESLYVDSTGAVVLEVTNTGDRAATDARALLQPAEPFSPLASSGSVGTLEPGESATTRFKLDVSDRALAQDYPLQFAVAHEDTHGNTVQSDTASADVTVGPERTFEVVEGAQIDAGATEQITLTVENSGGGTLEDAVVRINTNSPFETDDDTAHVGTLEPGETATATFTTTAGEDATPKSYSLDTTIKYDNPFGETVVSDVQTAPVEVTESEGGPLGLLFALAGVPLALVGAIAYRINLLSRLR